MLAEREVLAQELAHPATVGRVEALLAVIRLEIYLEQLQLYYPGGRGLVDHLQMHLLLQQCKGQMHLGCSLLIARMVLPVTARRKQA